MKPIITIITVTKNCASTIERTLKSIKSIKTIDIQYIVIDGVSTDETLEIISGYDDVVDILISEPDTGIYNAMNKGVMLAEGKYTIFLNGDDHLLVEDFNTALIMLNTDAPEILSCQSDVFEREGVKGARLFPSLWKLYFFNSIPHLSTFVSTSLQKKYGFREQFKIAADYDLFLRMYINGHHYTISELITTVHYRGGVSSDTVVSNCEIQNIRKSNLGRFVYILTQGILEINRLKKRVSLRLGM